MSKCNYPKADHKLSKVYYQTDEYGDICIDCHELYLEAKGLLHLMKKKTVKKPEGREKLSEETRRKLRATVLQRVTGEQMPLLPLSMLGVAVVMFAISAALAIFWFFVK